MQLIGGWPCRDVAIANGVLGRGRLFPPLSVKANGTLAVPAAPGTMLDRRSQDTTALSTSLTPVLLSSETSVIVPRASKVIIACTLTSPRQFM